MRRPDHDEWWIPRPILLVRDALVNVISEPALRERFSKATEYLKEQAPVCAREAIFYLYRELSAAAVVIQEELSEEESMLQQLIMAGLLDYQDFLTSEEPVKILEKPRIDNPNPTTGVAKVVNCSWCPFQLVVEEKCQGPYYHSCCRREINRRYQKAVERALHGPTKQATSEDSPVESPD